MTNVAPYAEPFGSEGTPNVDGRRIGVLLCHGFTGNPASMRPWGEYLADRGYAVSVPRLPGHGTTWQDMVTTGYDDYYGELEREYRLLEARTDAVVVAGLSMGGSLALRLAAHEPRIAGVVLVNAAVENSNRMLMLLPVLKHLTKAVPGIADDIKKEGVTEHGYDKTPLRPLHSMLAGWKKVRADLPRITQPILLFRSVEDHVVDARSARIIQESVGSTDVTERLLTDSYHVATIDNDAPRIFEESAAFIARVTAAA